MIPINDSYNVPARRAELHAISGPPLSTLLRLKSLFRGLPTGSPRVRLTATNSPNVDALLASTADLKWANFERTTSGHIVRFRVRLETWAIPFHGEARVERLAADRCTLHFGPHLLDVSGTPAALDGLAAYFRP